MLTPFWPNIENFLYFDWRKGVVKSAGWKTSRDLSRCNIYLRHGEHDIIQFPCSIFSSGKEALLRQTDIWLVPFWKPILLKLLRCAALHELFFFAQVMTSPAVAPTALVFLYSWDCSFDISRASCWLLVLNSSWFSKLVCPGVSQHCYFTLVYRLNCVTNWKRYVKA